MASRFVLRTGAAAAFAAAGLLFGIGLWQDSSEGKVLAVLLALLPLIGLAAITIPGMSLARVAWLLVLLLAGGRFLWRANPRVSP